MICEDIMQDQVEYVSPTDEALDAARKMRVHNIGFLPVCDKSGKVIGTLTDRDLAIRLVAENRSPSTTVRNVMTPGAITCRPKDDVRAAEMLMAHHRVSRVVVVHGDGLVAGVISLSDIAESVDAYHAAQTMKDVSRRETRNVASRREHRT
jgi:CBS domain-containing protein